MKIPDLKWPQREEAYDDNLLLDIEAGVVAYLVRGRNAWHSTWVRHWFRNAHLFSDIASAKAGAESRRQRGNVFYIRESPALIMRGPREAVVLCELGQAVPFAGFTGFDTVPVETTDGCWINGIYPGVSLKDAVAAFAEGSEHWNGSRVSDDRILRGLVDAEFVFAEHDGELQSMTSFAQGSLYSLGWHSDRAVSPPSSFGTTSIVDRWQQQVRAAARGAEGSKTLASSLIEYRESTLKAMPRSQWEIELSRRELAATLADYSRFELWRDARDRRFEIEGVLRDAEEEAKNAKAARFPPADTSAGMRAQRERLEQADQAVTDLLARLAHARAVEQDRHDAWRERDDSQRGSITN
ncbi:MAG: hypothetical protein JST33_00400 [Actinobacteria bacterium]|nr:hypothetical protein [Actinomycetota bacterium]